MTNRESMSPLKLGFAVLWPAFWTGMPLRLAFAFLLMAMGLITLHETAGLALLLLLMSPVSVGALVILTMGMEVHLGEGAGLAILFLLAIPIDIWALGLVSRTVFLERLRVVPPQSLGLTLWMRLAAAGLVYLPLCWLILGFVTDTAKSVTHSILEAELLKSIPVAERISLELTMWGSVSTVMLVALVFGGFWLAGTIVSRVSAAAEPATESYQGLITRWDLLRVPLDQGLMLTAFTLTGVVLALLFWAALPVSTPHPHEAYEMPASTEKPPIVPAESLANAEQVLGQAEASIEVLEKKAAEEPKGKGKGGKAKAGSKDAPNKAAAPQKEPAGAQASAAPAPNPKP